VAAFRRRFPDWQCVISTTTNTGMAEAQKHFADLPVIWWPFDFTWAVRRALETIKPNLVVLAEGEIWPNFVLAAREKGIPVAVINGRMSPRSFRRYCRLGWLARQLFPLLDLIAAQSAEYGRGFRSLGAASDRIHVTGSVKYDGVNGDRGNAKTRELAEVFGIREGELVWVAGSTQAPEEAIVLDIHRRLKLEQPNLRLFIVPRQQDRFDEVAKLLERSGEPFVRRSAPVADAPGSPGIVLMDTFGELGALWGLADLAFVGGSLDGKRGGQNMIEPAAYGAAVVFGPHVWNFRDTVDKLLAADAAVQVDDAAELETTIRQLLSDAKERQRLGQAARRLVLEQQGATERTIELLGGLIQRQRLSKAG
jgi:3-deoxy-D-manno-octulosonic-acid transferase